MDHETGLGNALRSLRGLSVGDAFGERFFGDPPAVAERISARRLPPAPWRWTDDTAMAIGIVETLAAQGRIEQDELAQRFAGRMMADPNRGYGGGAYRLLSLIHRGADWRRESVRLFDGGSWGNGSAMRTAPIGAWFHGDPLRAASEAAASAAVTHAHPEGIAGAVAIAVAASLAEPGEGMEWEAFFGSILDQVGPGKTRAGIEQAKALAEATTADAAARLGTGWNVAAFDTVPFCLWAAARFHDDYREAMWQTVSALGDRDTTCAIVGGIVALSAREGPPQEWIAATEALPPINR